MTFQDLRHTSRQNHILPPSERESALFDVKPQPRNNKKTTSQSMHFTKLEYTYHGPVIYFISCRSTNIIQLFYCYFPNWAHNVWKSHGTTVTPPGSSGFMLNNEDTILLALVSAKTLHKQGGDLQSNAKVSNTHHIFKEKIQIFTKTYDTDAALACSLGSVTFKVQKCYWILLNSWRSARK